MEGTNRFQDTGNLLGTHRSLWEPRPFLEDPAPWESEWPLVAQWCRALSSDAVDRHERHPWRLDGAPPAMREWADVCETLSAVPRIDGPSSADGFLDTRGIPARKVEQVRAFVRALAPIFRPGNRWVDWCSGKGHLGRALARVTSAPVTFLEIDGSLCESGAARGSDEGVDARFVHINVFDKGVGDEITGSSIVVGLHACGDLARELVLRAVERSARTVAVAPCCLQRIRGDVHRPLSRAAAESPLRLTRENLKLATTEQVHGTARVTRARKRSMALRMGFDLLAESVTGSDPRTRAQHVRAARIRLPFAGYCEEMAQETGLVLPTGWDPDNVLATARERVRQARGLQLVRWIFRRPLEIWVLLDLVHFLRESGYAARLVEFCPRDVTARNLLVFAERE